MPMQPDRESVMHPSAKAKPLPDPAEYTCPMHPQVRQMGPGHCPICGMALEPVLPIAEAGDSPELRDMTRRFWIGLALTGRARAARRASARLTFSSWKGRHWR